MKEPRVSIVLPTRNGAATLPAVLDAVARQRADLSFETVAVDSASTDGTAELLRDRVDRLIGIPAGEFDHGLTRNLGIEQSRGDLIVLLAQDAVPASEGWLADLTSPFVADSKVAGSFACQRPRSGIGPIARYYQARSPVSSNLPRTAALAGPGELEALAPMARLERCRFDNVCSCIRRAVWEQHPFRATPIAEDLEWAREVLLAGHTLAYVPSAVVIHSHERSVRYELLRTYLLHRRLYELFEVRTIPTLRDLARAVASSLALHRRCETETGGLGPSGRAIGLAFAWPLGQYLGALSAVRGWKPRRSQLV